MSNEMLTLQKMLEQYKMPILRSIAMHHNIKGVTRMRKGELISAIYQKLLDPDQLRDFVLMADVDDWKLIRRAAESDGPQRVTPKALGSAFFFSQNGYLYLSGDEQTFHIEMPAEIKSLFNSLRAEGLDDEKKRSDLLHAYSQAAVTLYGVIDLYELIEIFNRQNKEKTDIGELLHCHARHMYFNAHYMVWDTYLVYITFAEDNYEYVQPLLDETKGKPRYIPAKKEFLRYADEGYYESTASIDNLRAALIKDCGLSRTAAENAVAEVVCSIQAEATLAESFEVLAQNNVLVQEDMLPVFASMLTEVHNTSRLWTNKGYTPNELGAMLSVIPQKGDKKTPEKIKIGRNDPCPCGSGKKYKKCCGR